MEKFLTPVLKSYYLIKILTHETVLTHTVHFDSRVNIPHLTMGIC